MLTKENNDDDNQMMMMFAGREFVHGAMQQ